MWSLIPWLADYPGLPVWADVAIWRCFPNFGREKFWWWANLKMCQSRVYFNLISWPDWSWPRTTPDYLFRRRGYFAMFSQLCERDLSMADIKSRRIHLDRVKESLKHLKYLALAPDCLFGRTRLFGDVFQTLGEGNFNGWHKIASYLMTMSRVKYQTCDSFGLTCDHVLRRLERI